MSLNPLSMCLTDKELPSNPVGFGLNSFSQICQQHPQIPFNSQPSIPSNPHEIFGSKKLRKSNEIFVSEKLGKPKPKFDKNITIPKHINRINSKKTVDVCINCLYHGKNIIICVKLLMDSDPKIFKTAFIAQFPRFCYNKNTLHYFDKIIQHYLNSKYLESVPNFEKNLQTILNFTLQFKR